MSFLDFISRAIGDLAWPGLILGVVLFLKEDIQALISRVSSASIAGNNLTFSTKIEEVKGLADSINSSEEIGQDKAHDIPIPSSSKTVSVISPTEKVLKSWNRLFGLVLNRSQGSRFFKESDKTSKKVAWLSDKLGLPALQVEQINKLYDMFRDARAGADVQSEDADAYEEMINDIIVQIKKLPTPI